LYFTIENRLAFDSTTFILKLHWASIMSSFTKALLKAW